MFPVDLRLKFGLKSRVESLKNVKMPSMDGEHRRLIRRKRGLILSLQGVERLQQAIAQQENLHNQGQPYNTDDLSRLTGVSPASIRRVWARQAGIDSKTLQKIFSTFAIALTDADIQSTSGGSGAVESVAVSTGTVGRSRYPSGPLPLDSPLYIPRAPVEELAFREIAQVGCVLRIKAPAGFGKSSLLLRILDRAAQLNYITALIDLQQVEPRILEDSDQFLQWFRTSLALKLGCIPPPENPWGDDIGSHLSTTLYVREQLLTGISSPVVVAINAIEHLFPYATTAQTVLPLLRSWHEAAGHDPLWQLLRLVVTYATDCYLPLDMMISPFNIGLPLILPDFTPQQVISLANQYALAWQTSEAEQLIALVGGHPTLVHLAIYQVGNHLISFEELLASASTPQGIYHSYLQTMFVPLSGLPWQTEPLQMLRSDRGAVLLDPKLAFQLERAGIVRSTATGWQLRCELYRHYLNHYCILS